jgi:hypothetical protein
VQLPDVASGQTKQLEDAWEIKDRKMKAFAQYRAVLRAVT